MSEMLTLTSVMDEEILSSKNKLDLFKALPTFKYLKSIEIGKGLIYEDNFKNVIFRVKNLMCKKIESYQYQELCIEDSLIEALKNCLRLRHFSIIYCKLSVDFLNQIVKHGQNLISLELDIGRITLPGILPFLNLKNLKHLGLYNIKHLNFTVENLNVLVKHCKELTKICFSDYDCDNTIHGIHVERRNFLKNNIFLLFDNLPALRELNLICICSVKIYYNKKFVHSQLQLLAFAAHKHKLKLQMSGNMNLIKITREI